MGQCLLSILSLGFLLHCLIEYFPAFSCVFTVYMKNYKDNARLRVMLSFFREDLHLLLADGCAVVILDYLNAFNVEVRELDDGLKENNQHLRKFWESEVGPITEIRRSQERTVLGGIGVREKSRFN